MQVEFSKILIRSTDPDFQEKTGRLKTHHSMSDFLRCNEEIAGRVRDIVDEVGKRGDAAVAEFTERFDKVKLSPAEFRVLPSELKKAHSVLGVKLLESLRKAIANVKEYQSRIFIGGKTATGIRYTPLERVGICVPGASAPLPSTVIMTAVPAIVAGVKEIVVISPPRYNGSINPVILGLCYELGIEEVYRIGGAQAVAALAWGTKTIRKVDKIAGPGNDYVQLAKKEVFGLVDMDSFAGPSDVLIIADRTARADWVAADMLSQAEHNPGTGILVTDSEQLAEKVVSELQRQVEQLGRAEGAANCIKEYSAIVVVEDMEAAIDFCNDFAAEHLQVQCGEWSRKVAEKIRNAGAIFIGDFTCVAVGDYWAGPSHTLPTRQTAKYFSAVTSNDFVKSTSIVEYDKKKLAESAEDIIRLAETEGLDAHAKSVRIRLEE